MGSEKGAENRASVCLGAEAFAGAGGRVVLGSDPYARSEGRVPGLADHDTIKKVVTFGFSPLETIRMATLDGSTFLGIQDRTGTIAVGKEAERTESHTTPVAFLSCQGLGRFAVSSAIPPRNERSHAAIPLTPLEGLDLYPGRLRPRSLRGWL